MLLMLFVLSLLIMLIMNYLWLSVPSLLVYVCAPYLLVTISIVLYCFHKIRENDTDNDNIWTIADAKRARYMARITKDDD